MRHPAAATVLALVLLLAASAAAEPLSFDEAIALSASAPDVRGVSRARAVRRTNDADISRLTHPTELQLVPGYRVRSEEDRGFEGQIGLSQGWNLAGLARARKRAASDERDALFARERALKLERRLGAARAWIELRVLEAQVALANDEHRTARELAERIARAAEAGVLTRADAADARAFASEAELRVLAAEAEHFAAVLALAAALGRKANEELVTRGEAPAPGLPGDQELEALLLDVTELPPVVAARLEAVAARTREVEVGASYGTTLSTAVQLYREAPNGMMVFGQLTLGLPLQNLGARERARALAEAELRSSEHEEKLLEAQRNALAIVHEVKHARRELGALHEDVVPALDELVATRERQLSASQTTVFQVLEARRRRVAARARLERAEGALRWAEVRAWLWLAVRTEVVR